VTPDAAFDTPVTQHDDDSVVEDLLAGFYETPVPVDLPEDEATVTVGQRDALLNMGCPIEEIDIATTYDAIDELFNRYGNRPSPGQMEFLRKRGVPNLVKVTTRELAGKVSGYGPLSCFHRINFALMLNSVFFTQLITRIKMDSPATRRQLRYLRILYDRVIITTALKRCR
jgi:hypothetical protein